MSDVLKVRNLDDNTWQVVMFYESDDDRYAFEDELVVYQGGLSDCESYIRLKNNGLLV